ncbi:hypothetical protein [Leeia sp.]|uniref:hypothetical protein n=1 Tax=Leeia sp. TaxID=2884678 RepID=UPI0035B2FE33
MALALTLISGTTFANDYFNCKPNLDLQEFDHEFMNYGWRSPKAVQALLCGVLKQRDYENTSYAKGVLYSYADSQLRMTSKEWVEHYKIYGSVLPKNISISDNIAFSKSAIIKLSLDPDDDSAKYKLAMCLLGEHKGNDYFFGCEWKGFDKDKEKGLRMLNDIAGLPSSGKLSSAYSGDALRYLALFHFEHGAINKAYCLSARQRSISPNDDWASEFHEDIVRRIKRKKGRFSIPCPR